MNFEGQQGPFYNHFQNLEFDDRKENDDPSDKTYIYRNLMAQISFAANSKFVSAHAIEMLLSDYSQHYINIVDSYKKNEGLNNFAEGALQICSYNKNESAQWESSLNTENILEMDCLQQLVKKSQKFTQRYTNKSTVQLLNMFDVTKTAGVNEKSTCNQVPASNQTPITDFSSKFSPPLPKVVSEGDPSKKNDYFGSNFHFNKTTAFGTIGGNKSSHASQNYISGQYDTNYISGHQYQDFTSVANDRVKESFIGNTLNRTFFSKKSLFTNSGSGCQENSSSRFDYDQAVDQKNRHQFWRSTGQDIEDDNEFEKYPAKSIDFRTAREQMVVNHQKKYERGGVGSGSTTTSVSRKCLGTRRGLNSKFVSPMNNRDQENYEGDGLTHSSSIKRPVVGKNEENECVDGRLKGIDPKIIELIMNEIMDHGPGVNWDDIAGLEFAKKNIKEIVVWPMLRPDIFTGLRGPPKGLLLFGPPGTGKTLIGKCIASQSKSTFFSISASSLTSKWVGEGEKTVRALFAVARCHQPTVIFIDEIDSLLSQRNDNEHESSRRIKTEFLVQLDGATTESEERLLIIGATNRPHEIDEAARRRFVRRLYIPLPDANARKQIILNLLCKQKHYLNPEELEIICQKTEGYSGADMNNLCREAALGPIRSLPFGDIENITADEVRPIEFSDFEDALLQVKASVSSKDLQGYNVWNKMYGSGSSTK